MKPVVILALSLALAPSLARAQDAWPIRSVTFVIPYAAGGYTDLVGRLAARFVERELGKPVIIDNRSGGGGIVGTQAVANAVPDGYLLCVCSIGAVSIAPFAQKVGYDPIEDLAPIGIVSSIPQAVIVRTGLPVKSINDFVLYARANPGKLNYSSSGVGGLTHYTVELFLARTGTSAVHIPFRGGAPSTAAVVSGEVDFAFANMTEALPLDVRWFTRLRFVDCLLIISSRPSRPETCSSFPPWSHFGTARPSSVTSLPFGKRIGWSTPSNPSPDLTKS
jgi:tripartite-type tricarboxylate transporter receptor subunit TctC